MDLRDLYMAQRDGLISLVLDNVEQGDLPVPACPDWRIRHVVGHLVGLAQDAVGGSLPDMDLLEQWRDVAVAATRDGMTAEQVTRSADDRLEDLVATWQGLSDELGSMLSGERSFPSPAPPGIEAVLVTDLVVHDQDIRGALGIACATEGSALSVALATYAFSVDYRIRQLALPALGIGYGGKTRVLGEGTPVATLSGDRSELVRVFGGRRSRSQILALDWTGDPVPYVDLLPAYGERTEDLFQ